ncbi:ROK family transcriptional regulator [Nonomuraea gerenzanensis]|uniref:Xylose-responsive transcription regulator, ROK family n=1 Tax=Nonomuraea gerenzanensis TaxID=93944 RepID=A0A1M4EDZ7_9ACTN|nr:ROK family transcriptional regulator [Nonomuraea gerenzanensis]UBU08549.1 ROK family transcriptional regulator [Nonomuraea gerenzanensis]SBO96898.1 Xylose-responsive transcription regulator, ROK family [Nonomuraea gerenzanensis]
MAGTDRGDLTRTAILALLGTVGPLSRSEMARELDLSPATVTQLTKELIGHGMLEELDLKPSRGGRPAQRLGLVGSAGRALGVKVTADHLVLVDVRLDGEVLGSWERPHDPAAPDALEHLADAVESVVREISGVPPLLGVGVGVPGSVDDQAVGTVNAPTLGWQAMPVGERLRRRLRLPVLVENDVNALAAAERLYGRGRTHSDFLVVTIGRGVGAAIVADGRVYRGARGGAGEFGHLPVDAEGPPCGCGARGCLEAFVGSAGLLAAARAGKGPGNGLAGVDGLADVHDPLGAVAALGRAAAGGDVAAREVFAEAGAILGRATAGLINVVDPEVVVVLGEGTADWPLWRAGFEPALRAQLYPGRRDISVEVESWDDTSWAQGAAALVLATPFDSAGAAGEQGRLVRARLIGAGS